MMILYTMPDGGVSVVHAAPKEDLEKVLGGLTDEQYREHVWSRSIPKDALNALELPDNYQLPGREFRNAWLQNGKAVEHDLEKARTIQLDRMRTARELKFAELDKEFMLALEKGLSTADIKSKKDALRAITETLKKKSLNNIEDVRCEFPEELRG